MPEIQTNNAMSPKKSLPKTQKEYREKFIQKLKEREGISIRTKYLETNRRAERNCKHRTNAILAIKYLFGIRTLI